MDKEKEKRERWPFEFGLSVPRASRLGGDIQPGSTNQEERSPTKSLREFEEEFNRKVLLNIKPNKMEKESLTEKEHQEQIERQDEFIKGFGNDVAERIMKELPHERQGEFFRIVKDIIYYKHESRISECSRCLEGLKNEFETFQTGLNGKG